MARRAFKIIVDPIECDARGVCAELFPEWITIDPWGYPIIKNTAIPPNLLDHARRAVDSCPKLALIFVEERSD